MTDVKIACALFVGFGQDRPLRAGVRRWRGMALSLSPPAAPRVPCAMRASKYATFPNSTGFPEMMDGRVNTLHPKVHGGLLVATILAHAASMVEHGIGAIDDPRRRQPHPFAETLARGAGREEVIENIDIGGPSMVRSAASMPMSPSLPITATMPS